MTHQTKLEQQIDQTLQEILDQTYSCFIATDVNGVITHWNHQAEITFGWSRLEAVGQTLTETIVPPQYQDIFVGNLKHYQSIGIEDGVEDPTNRSIDTTARRKDGSEFPVEWSIFPVHIGSKYSFCAFATDITERKALMKQLQDKQADLERSNSELQRFAYVAAHDLKEPLRTIVSYTNLLEQQCKGKLNKDAQENMGFIIDAGMQMQQLVSDLLTYARVETQAGEFVATECGTVFNQVVNILETTIKEENAQITCDALPTVLADPLQLSQVFLNMLANALKFRGQQRPTVHVSARQSGDEWLFSVKDNGIGIDMKFADRVFEMFQRLHSKAEYPGTGIGLAICKKIVERYKGRIWFESEPGKGTIFFFTLPVMRP